MKKDKPRSHERHHIPAPTTGTTQITPNGAVILADKAFLDGAKERIHDLFVTEQGLPGHVTQVQQELNRLNNSNLSPGRKRLLGDEMFDQISKAASHVEHNIPETTFTLPSADRTYTIQKPQGGTVTAYPAPYVDPADLA